MGALHSQLVQLVASSTRGEGKGAIIMMGYRTPQGNGMLERYNNGGPAEALADRIVDEEQLLISKWFPHAYKLCMAFVREFRSEHAMAPCVGSSAFTCKAVSEGSFDPVLHVDSGDFDHSFILHWDHVPAGGGAIQGGGFLVTVRYQPTSGSMLYIRTASVAHKSLPCISPEHRYGTALFVAPRCLNQAQLRQHLFNNLLSAMKAAGRYAYKRLAADVGAMITRLPPRKRAPRG
jgi:hypothetical protein